MSRILDVTLVISGEDAILVGSRAQAERLVRFLDDDEPMENVTILGSFSRDNLKEGVR